MKKLLILFLTVGTILPALGQSANEILDAVNKKYASFNSYAADFSVGNQKASIISKGNKYKITFGSQEVYNNGKEVYTYIPETNEVNISSYQAGDESDISPNNIFKLYKKGYTATKNGTKTVAGKKLENIVLTPKGKSDFTKIELLVNNTDKLISSWTVYQKNGSTNYSITKFTPNVSATDATFTFDKKKYPKVEIVDLR